MCVLLFLVFVQNGKAVLVQQLLQKRPFLVLFSIAHSVAGLHLYKSFGQVEYYLFVLVVDVYDAAGKVINGFSGFGAELYVPASRVEEAMALLSADICQEEKEEE